MNTIKVLGSGSSGNCYIVNIEDDILILDAGFKYKDILKGINYNIGSVAGALITHQHL
jgi:metallo-beta-lactamase domain protein